MDTTPISANFLLASLLTVVLMEAAAAAIGFHLHVPRLWLLAAARSVEILALVLLAALRTGGLTMIGLQPKTLLPGLGKGLAWSAAFAGVAALLFGLLYLAGQHPLTLVRAPLPPHPTQRVLYFFVGGILAPAAEEIVFRGLIFGYLRRWGLPAAVLISTALFAAFHLPTIPVTQIIGGIVFALAYVSTGSLMTPIAIHMLGNLAIFTLSLAHF
jgi:membrane protease YdiL (CAAX protease family)